MINFSGESQFLVRQFLQFDQLVIAIERIDQYCQLESEPKNDMPSDEKLKKENWPQQGVIEFKNVRMKYNELNKDFILKNVNFKI